MNAFAPAQSASCALVMRMQISADGISMLLSLRYLSTAIDANEPERFFDAPSEFSLLSAKRGIAATGTKTTSASETYLSAALLAKRSVEALRNTASRATTKPAAEMIAKIVVLNLRLSAESLLARRIRRFSLDFCLVF